MIDQCAAPLFVSALLQQDIAAAARRGHFDFPCPLGVFRNHCEKAPEYLLTETVGVVI